MTQDSRPQRRRMDGRSWRYLGLAVGLAGLIYLNWQLPVAPESTPTGPDSSRLEVAKTINQPPAEAWLEALWQADTQAVTDLLQGGADADAPLDRRQTRPLHLLYFGDACSRGAAAEGVLEVTSLLINAGARVNRPDERGNTPLMLAAAECDGSVVRRLLAAGADMTAVNTLGLTAFELTLTNASSTGTVLAEAGFQLSPSQYEHYLTVYHDEPAVLDHLRQARPVNMQPEP